MLEFSVSTTKNISTYCNTMYVVRQEDDSFVWRETRRRVLDLRSRRDRKWVREREPESWTKELEEAVGEGRRREAVDTG